MSVVQNLCILTLRQVVAAASQAIGVDATAAFQVIQDHLTDHSGRLIRALRNANERAWQALEIALAGESLWERCKLLTARAEDKAFGLQVRGFLDAAPLPELAGKTNFRQTVLDELRAARKNGLLTGGLEPHELARRAGTFARFRDPDRILRAERQATRELADEVDRAGYRNLAWFLGQQPPPGDSLLVVAVRYFFRREVEADAELFRGLTWAKLEGLGAKLEGLGQMQAGGLARIDDLVREALIKQEELGQAQEAGFASLAAALDRHADRLAELLAGIQDVVVATRGGVLDLQAEQGRQGAVLADLYEKVVEQHRRFDLLDRHLRREDSLSIRSDAERQLVRALVSRFRALPADQQRQLPALLNALAKLQMAAGQLDDAQQDFGTVATTVAEPAAQAEAHFNAYQTALGRGDWSLALEELLKAVRLNAKRFAPFPMAKYHPKRILGAGGFGVAFLCRHKDFDADVVIKALRDDGLGRDVKEVLSEARVLHRLEHRCIVQVLDCGYTLPNERARPYFVMSHFDGVTLEEQVRERPLSVADCLAVVREMAEGLRAAHAKGILHRDIKPANVLVRRDPDGWQVKLIDFGLALRSDALHNTRNDSSTQEHPAAPGGVAGTLDYAPPEQLGRLPGVAVGRYSDVYGLAKTCCYARFRTTQPLPKHWASLPAALAKLLEECLDEDPAARPVDAAAVLARLDALQPGRTAGGKPAEALAATLTWLRQAAQPLLPGGTSTAEPVGGAPGSGAPDRGSASAGMPRPHLVSDDAKRGRIILDLAPETILSALFEAFVQFGVREIVRDQQTLTLVGKTGGNLWSFGQTIRGVIERVDQGSLVTVTSRPSGQLYDWGRGKEEARQVLGLLINRITAVQPGADSTRPLFAGGAPGTGASDGAPAAGAGAAASGKPGPVQGADPGPRVAEDAVAFAGHKGRVLSVVFAPDGNAILSAGADGSSRLWDLRGKELLCLQSPRGWSRPAAVVYAAFMPDQCRALSVAADGAVRLWNLKTGGEVRRFVAAGGVAAASLSVDGRRLLAGVRRSVTLWDVEQGRLILRLGETSNEPKGDVQCVAFTPRGGSLAGGLDGVALVYSGQETLRLEGHTGGVYTIAAHPNGRHVLTGSGDHRLFLWDLERGEGWAYTGHTGEVLGVALSRDGRLALSGGADQTVRLWQLSNRKQVGCFRGHVAQVRCVAFSPVGGQAVSGADDGVIRIWSLGN